MKNKLGNFLEIFGIVLGLAGIVGFVILLINNMIFQGIISLAAGVCIFVFSLAVSQMLFSVSDIEEKTDIMNKRMEVLEIMNREAIEKDFFAAQPRKNVNTVKKTGQTSKKQPISAGVQASCYKCGYKGNFSGSNMCPKCGNHSFYTD